MKTNEFGREFACVWKQKSPSMLDGPGRAEAMSEALDPGAHHHSTLGPDPMAVAMMRAMVVANGTLHGRSG